MNLLICPTGWVCRCAQIRRMMLCSGRGAACCGGIPIIEPLTVAVISDIHVWIPTSEIGTWWISRAYQAMSVTEIRAEVARVGGDF